jgi:hypothetical protein
LLLEVAGEGVAEGVGGELIGEAGRQGEALGDELLQLVEVKPVLLELG